MPAAARIGDMARQDTPHCHAPIHPPAPTPTPVPHPALPVTIITGAFTVLIGNQPAAQIGSTTTPCTTAGCVPGGPANVVMGSTTVMVGGMPAARVNDMTAHTSCVAPIPSPVGKIMPPGCLTVIIGG